MDKQICKSCKTIFTDKGWIDGCPVCRGSRLARWDYITYWDYVAGKEKTELVKLT